MKPRWQDWIDLALGMWLFFSPWLLYYTHVGGAQWQSYFLGVSVFLFALWSLFDKRAIGEGLNAAIGAWLVVSPWILGFYRQMPPTANDVAIGTAIALIALSAFMRPQAYESRDHGHR